MAGATRWADDVHSTMIPDPTFAFVGVRVALQSTVYVILDKGYVKRIDTFAFWHLLMNITLGNWLMVIVCLYTMLYILGVKKTILSTE